MGGIVDAIVDIISDIVDLVVDIVETVVDLVVDVVDAVFDTMADLLGFDQDDPQVVQQFQVHNQALFENPDNTSLSQIIYDSIVNEEDIAANILYAEVFQSGKKNVRKFTEFIENDNYFEDFPTVQANIITVDYDEVDDVLTTLNSTPITIDTAKLGTLFVPNWLKYWLQVNKSYDHNATTFVHSSTTYTVNIYNTDYNSGSNTYTLRLGSPLANFTGFTVPAKPTGLHYIVYYHKDNAPNDPLIWIYKVGDGTYTDLDEPSQEFGESGSDTLDILPAIPLRINNTNFNATSTTKSQQITDLVEKVGLDAPELISSIMDDVADAGISDYQNKVDHVFLNFGVRMWDTSQIGINYCFRFVSTLYPGQASTEGDYNAAPDDKPYNTLLVTGTDYKYTFRFAYIKFVHTALAAIDADATSTAHAIYYSDLSRFTSGAKGNDDLIAPYYISSGVGGYNVGYYCSTTAQITQFLAGTLTQNSSYDSEAADWMQPTQRITFTGTLLNADGSANSDGAVKPSLVYQKIVDAFYSSGVFQHCIDHFLYVRYDGDGHVEIAGAEPSGNVHTGRGDCGGVAQGWRTGLNVDVTNYTNITITVVAQSGWGGGGTWTNTRAVGSSLGNTTVTTYGAGGAQQPQIRVDVTLDADGSTTALQLVNRAAETTTSKQEMTYYQATTAGLNAYTIKAPKCLLRVVDAQTGQFKMVSFNLAETYDLMIPMSYDMVKDLPNAHVSSLFVAAAHISLYVAHYEVISTPLWVKLLKIVQVVIFIIALMTAPNIAKFIATIIKQVVANLIIKKVVTELAKISPELAVLAVAAYMYYGGKLEDIDWTSFGDLAQVLADVSNLIVPIIETYAYEELEDLRDEDEKQKVLQDKQMDALHEVQEALFVDNNGVSLDLTKSYRSVRINPMMPAQYLATSIDNYHLIGFSDFDYDIKYKQAFEPEIMIT